MSHAPGLATVRAPLLSRAQTLAAAAIVLGGLAALILYRPGRLEPSAVILAALVVLAGCIPALFYATAATREPFPFLALTGLFYAVFFGATSLLLDVGWSQDQPMRMYDVWLVDTIHPKTLLLVLLGVILLIGGFLATRHGLLRTLPYWRLPVPQPTDRVRALSWVLLALHSALIWIPETRNIPSAGQLTEPTALIAYGLFYYRWQTRLGPPLESMAVLALLLPVELIYTWTKGGLADVFALPLFLIFVHLQATQRLPTKAILAVAASFLIAYNINATFRELTWHTYDPYRYQKYRDASTVERAELLARLVTDYVTGSAITEMRADTYVATKGSATEILGPLVRRIALAVPTEKLMQATPAEVPYWGGESYRNLLTNLVPRILWPNKPIETVGSIVPARYGLRFPKELPTAINLPWVTELYLNFGPLGVLCGMLSVGVFLAFLDRFFNRVEMTPVEAIIGSALIFRLFYQESNFTVMVGSILSLAVFFWIFFWIGLTAPWRSLLRHP